MTESETPLLAAFMILLSVPALANISAGDGAAITVGSGSSVTMHGTTIYTNDCVIQKGGLCLKLHEGWTWDITNENGEEIVNGKKMSEFPPCTKDTITDCLEKLP